MLVVRVGLFWPLVLLSELLLPSAFSCGLSGGRFSSWLAAGGLAGDAGGLTGDRGGVAIIFEGSSLRADANCVPFSSLGLIVRFGADFTGRCRLGSASGTGVPGVGVETKSLYELSLTRGCFQGNRRRLMQQKMMARDQISVGRGSYFFSS